MAEDNNTLGTQGQASPDIKIEPPKPPDSGEPAVFKAAIRTMQEDIASIKKGEGPTGFTIEKQSEKDIVRPQVPSPKITPPSQPAVQAELGKLEKSRLLDGSIPIVHSFRIQPVTPAPLQSVSMGKAESSSKIKITEGPVLHARNIKKILIYTIAGAVGFALTAFLMPKLARYLSDIKPSPSPTPVVTRDTSDSQISIETYFPIFRSVSQVLDSDFTPKFESLINSLELVSSKQPGLYKIIDPVSSQSYTLDEFLSGTSIQAPQELLPSLNQGRFYLTAISKTDNKNGYGLIIKVNNLLDTAIAMKSWETSITPTLIKLFGYESDKAASIEFLDNTYDSVQIRYRNFPDPNSTIDYAVFAAKNGENYLVVTNSREHIYVLIDKMK